MTQVLDPQDWRHARLVAVLSGSLFGLTGMGSSAVAVVLPNIADSFETSLNSTALVVSTYAVCLAVATAMYGTVADRFGLRTAIGIGVGLMSTMSLVCAVAPTFWILIVARGLQGVGAAGVAVLVIAVVNDRFQGAVRKAALARTVGTAIAVGATGPFVGGVLAGLVSWRVVMLLPLATPFMFAALWRLAPTGGRKVELDFVGAALVMFTAGLALVVLQLVESPGTPMLVVAGLLVAVVPLLVAWIHRHPTGFVPIAVLRSGGLVGASITASLVAAVWLALLVAVPAELSAQGWSPQAIGAGLLPGALPGIFGPTIAGRVIHRIGSGNAVTLAAAIAVLALLVAAVGFAAGPVVLLAATVVGNAAFAIGHPGLGAVVADLIVPELRAGATSLSSLVFFMGAGFGGAVGGLGVAVGPAQALLSLAGLALLITVVEAASRRRTA